MESLIQFYRYKRRLKSFPAFLFLILTGILGLAQEPVISVRFANPQYDCVTKTYCLQVEFQSDTPDKQLFGMNVRFFYDDNILEFHSFGNFSNGYGAVSPNPPYKSTSNVSVGKTYFGLSGAAELINGGVELVNPSVITYISVAGWTRLFNICFTVDDQEALLSGNFCPSVIWDMEENPNDGGFYGGDGVVMTLVKTQYTQTEPCKEKVIQFNWAYDGIAGLPHGNPVSKVCIAVPCGINAVDDNTGSAPVNGTTGGIAISNVLLNDKLNGNQATTGNVNLSAVNDPVDGVTLNVATGAVTVAPGTPAGFYTITYRICEKANPSNCDDALITVAVAASDKSADLSIVKTVSNSAPSTGSNITFTLTVTNHGPSGTTGVLVTDVLPAGFTLISATPSSGTWAAPVWTIGNLDNGASRTLTMIVRVNSSGPYSNTATVSGTEIDPVSENNSDTETISPVVINLTDLTLTKSADNEKPIFGTNITFTITVANNGPANATTLRITDILPSGFSLISANVTAGTWTAPTWSISNLNAGVTQKLTIVAKVNTTGPYVNTAAVTGNETDPDAKNNSDTVTVVPAVIPQSDLVIIKTVDNSTPAAGSNVTFSITATNNGPANATSVKVSDVLPAGYSLVTATPSSGTWSAPDWTIGNLASGTSSTLTLIARVNATGPYTNSAIISGSESDPVPGNNTSSVTTIPTGTTLTATNEVIEMCNSVTSKGNVLNNEGSGGGQLTVRNTPVLAPLHGTIAVNADGNFSYTPFSGYSGSDKAVLEICNAVVCANDTLFFHIIAMPESQAGNDMTSCEGEQVRLAGNYVPDVDEKWSQLSGPNNPLISRADSAVATVSCLIAGAYLFGYQLSSGGCSDEDTLLLTVFASPTAFAGDDVVICSGNSYQVRDDRATNYSSVQWTLTGPGTLSGFNALHPVYTSGKNDTGRVVLLMKANPSVSGQCPAATDTMVIRVTPSPELTCPKEGNFTIDVTPGTCHWVSPPGSLSTGLAGGSCSATLTWRVTNPDKTIRTGTNDVSGYIFIPGLSAVTYFLEGASGGSKDSCTFTVMVLDNEKPALLCSPATEINLNPGECDREILLVPPEFKDNCTTLSDMVYSVLNPDLSVAGPFELTQLAYRFVVGESQVEWTATDDKGEKVICRQLLTLYPDKLVVNAGQDGTVCEGAGWQLLQSGAPAGTQLKWRSSGNGTFSDPAVLQPIYTPGTADIQKGQVTLTLIASTQCAHDSDQVVLTISRLPSVDAGPDFPACEGEPLILNGAAAQNATIKWETSGKGNLSGDGTLSPVYTQASGEKGLIRFVIEGKGTGGCSSITISDTVWADIHPALQVSAGEDRIVLVNSRTNLSAGVSGGSGSYLYRWEPVNSVVSWDNDSIETLPLTVDTRFVIMVTDDRTGCSGSDTVNVTVTNDADEVLVFYNAVSPNGDGLNDVWYIDGIGSFPDNVVMIFNRWGDKIREFARYGQDEVMWDGTNRNGKRVPDGTYYYMVEIKGLKKYTGWIQVKSSL